MRLTLRTMLAYLDDILEPSDTHDIGRKIEESEFASGLVTRIHDCMRRLRLGAPSLNGRGMGLDPNTVAEYLDNTLPAERVPEFEKVCLESDMHLAEVASCHQILTLVLGEPVEVNPASRQQLYRLAEKIVSAASSAAADTVEMPIIVEPATQSPPRKKPEVPPYLRNADRRRRLWPWAAAAALFIAFVSGAVVVAWKLTAEPVALSDATASGAAKNQSAPVSPPVDEAGTSPATSPPAAGSTEAADEGKTSPTTETQNASAAPPVSPKQTTAEESPTDDTVPTEAVPTEAVPADVADAVPATSPAQTPGERPAEEEADVAATPTNGATTASGKMPNPLRPGAAAGAPTGGEPADAPTGNPTRPAAASAQIGRYVSENSVLLEQEPGNEWLRVPGREAVATDRTLVALPSFRPTIALSNGVTVQVLGGASFEVDAPDANGVLGVGLGSGRLVLMSTGRPDVQMRVRFGEQLGLLTFGDPSTTAAFEVIGTRAPGTNPENDPPQFQVYLYAGSGSLLWQAPGAAQPEAMMAPAKRGWDGNTSESNASESGAEGIPDWITQEPEISSLDRRAADVLNENLAPGRPVPLGLKELAGDRRREVRSLTVRSLAVLGEFEPLLAALGDPGQRAGWRPYVETLVAAVDRGPAMATQVRQAFESLSPDNAQQLYRMLWGYTEAQLRGGTASTLVNYLDQEDMLFRALSFWNLEQLAGQGFAYRPQDSQAVRAPHVRRWRQWALKYEPVSKPAAGR